MNILYLCNKNTFDTKMSRVRFHGIEELAKIANVTYSGKNWDNWNNDLTVDENVDILYPNDDLDWIIMYKPLELSGIKESRHKKCIRYNEMYDVKWTKKEINKSNPDLVVCHHLNDMPKYEGMPQKFVNISHCAKASVYKDYGLEKKWDVLFVGAVSRHYPFRQRLKKILNQHLKGRVKCKILKHPGSDFQKAKEKGTVLEGYAKIINQAKIVLTCSGKYKSRFGKYTEVPMSGTVLAADLPDEDHDFFKKFVWELKPECTDEQIALKIMHLLNDPDLLEHYRRQGIEMNKEYTQEHYAKRLLKELEDFESPSE